MEKEYELYDMLTTVEPGEPPYIVTKGPHVFSSDAVTKRAPFPDGRYSESTKNEIPASLLNQFRDERFNVKTNVIDVNGLDPDSIRRFTRECAGMVTVVDGKVNVLGLVETAPETVQNVARILVNIVYEKYDLGIEARQAAKDAEIARNREAYIAERLKAEPVLGGKQGEPTEPVEPTE